MEVVEIDMPTIGPYIKVEEMNAPSATAPPPAPSTSAPPTNDPLPTPNFLKAPSKMTPKVAVAASLRAPDDPVNDSFPAPDVANDGVASSSDDASFDDISTSSDSKDHTKAPIIVGLPAQKRQHPGAKKEDTKAGA